MWMNNYQAKAKETAIYPRFVGPVPHRDAPDTRVPVGLPYVALGLAGEAGEISNQVKKVMRDDGFDLTEIRRDQLVDELGDVLWYVALMAEELGEDLEMVALRNLEKLGHRASRNMIGGDGDKR